MITYFANRRFTILGHAATGLKDGLQVYDDTKEENLETGTATFEFILGYTEEQHVKAKELCHEGNYVIRWDEDDGQEVFTIISMEDNSDECEISVYAEDLGLDLLNEIAPAWENHTKYTINQYMNKYLHDSGFTIRVNELTGQMRALSWDGDSTVTERILSIAEGFGAEVRFSFDITPTMIRNKYVDIYYQRGKDIQLEFRLGSQIKSIVEKRSIENLVTAVTAEGGTPYAYHMWASDQNGSNMGESETYKVNGKSVQKGWFGYTVTSTSQTAPTNASAYTWISRAEYDRDKDTGRFEAKQVTLSGYSYNDGDFYVDGNLLCSKKAVYKWSRYLAEHDAGDIGHLVGAYSSNAITQASLFSEALAYLKKHCVPEISYEVDFHDFPHNVKLGDTIRIIDDKGELYLSARVKKLTKKTSEKRWEASLGDYKELSSGISSQIQQMANKFSVTAQEAIRKANEAKEAAGKATTDFYYEYSQSQSARVPPSVDDPDLWSAVPPERKDGYFIWQRSVKIAGSEITYGDPVCISGANGQDAVTLYIESSNGTTFKNSAISTTLTIDIFVGGELITDSTALAEKFGSDACLQWRQKPEGTESWTDIPSTDTRLSDNGFIFTLSANDVLERTVFSCDLIY